MIGFQKCPLLEPRPYGYRYSPEDPVAHRRHDLRRGDPRFHAGLVSAHRRACCDALVCSPDLGEPHRSEVVALAPAETPNLRVSQAPSRSPGTPGASAPSLGGTP